MKSLIQSFSKPALYRIALWAFIFSLAGYPQINEEFVPLKEGFNLDKNSTSQVAFTPTQGRGIIFKLSVQTSDPQGDPVYRALKVQVNGVEISSGLVTAKYRRQQVTWEVPSSYFIQNQKNVITVTLPKPSPKDFPYVIPEIKVLNYNYISPNIPVAFVTLDSEKESSFAIHSVNYLEFIKIFLMVFAGFSFCQVIFHPLLYLGKPAVLFAKNKFYFLLALLPVMIGLFSITTTYEVLFPSSTLFWLILIAMLIFVVFGVLFVGSICPRWLGVILPQHCRENEFIQQGFERFHQRLYSAVTVFPLSVNAKFILLASILTPVLLYWWGVFTYSINIGLYDDSTLFSMLSTLDEAEGLQEKAAILFGQSSGHRNVTVKIVAWLLVLLTGEIDFKLASILGSLSLAFLLILFYRVFPVTQYKVLYFIPVIPFVLSLNNWGLVIRPIYPLSNYYTLVYAGFALWFLCKPGNLFFVFALLLSFMATFNMAAGMLIFVPGQLYLIAQRDIKRGLVWFLFGTACTLYYLDGINFGGFASFMVEGSMTPLNYIGFYLTFLGSSLSRGRTIVAIPTGLVGVIWFIYLTRKQYYFNNPVVYFLMLFVLIVGLAVAYGRTEFGVGAALSLRYQLSSVVFMALLYLSAVEILGGESHHKKIIFTSYLAVLMLGFQLLSIKNNTLKVQGERNEYINTMRIMFPFVAGEKEFNYTPTSDNNVLQGSSGYLLEALNKNRYFLPCDELYPNKKIDHRWCQ
jgi:hypothetical protein